jgi:hypothetical protein
MFQRSEKRDRNGGVVNGNKFYKLSHLRKIDPESKKELPQRGNEAITAKIVVGEGGANFSIDEIKECIKNNTGAKKMLKGANVNRIDSQISIVENENDANGFTIEELKEIVRCYEPGFMKAGRPKKDDDAA